MGGDDGVLSWFMYQKLLEFKLKEVISREPTLLVLVVGVPNVGKSSLINLIHQIVSFAFLIAHQPIIHVLDTPGVLVPSILDIETGLKLALAGAHKRFSGR
nr:short integuments 2, mitochondrial [Quercus suber]